MICCEYVNYNYNTWCYPFIFHIETEILWRLILDTGAENQVRVAVYMYQHVSVNQRSGLLCLCPQPTVPSCLACGIICLLPASRWVHRTVGHQPVVCRSFSSTFLVFIKSNTLSHADDDIPRVLTCETLAVLHLTIAWQSDSSAVLHNISAGNRNVLCMIWPNQTIAVSQSF